MDALGGARRGMRGPISCKKAKKRSRNPLVASGHLGHFQVLSGAFGGVGGI